jgi:hypothetical protein
MLSCPRQKGAVEDKPQHQIKQKNIYKTATPNITRTTIIYHEDTHGLLSDYNYADGDIRRLEIH